MVQSNTHLTLHWKAETNYAGGDGGAEYAETHATSTSDFTAFNYLGGTVNMRAKEYNRTRLKAPGIGLGKGLMITSGADFPEIELSYYMQGADDWIARLDDGTEGITSSSFIFNVRVPDETLEATSTSYITYSVFGAHIKEISIKGAINQETPPIVNVKYIAYDVIKDPTPIDFSTVAIPETTISEWDDMTVSIGTTTTSEVTELKEFTLTVSNEYVDVGAGRNSSFNKFKPLLKDKMLDYTITAYKEEGFDMSDKIIETIDEAVICELNTGSEVIKITNCYMDSSNYLEHAGDDITEVEYTMTYKNGNSTYTVT